jgi:hypothetical protein
MFFINHLPTDRHPMPGTRSPYGPRPAPPCASSGANRPPSAEIEWPVTAAISCISAPPSAIRTTAVLIEIIRHQLLPTSPDSHPRRRKVVGIIVIAAAARCAGWLRVPTRLLQASPSPSSHFGIAKALTIGCACLRQWANEEEPSTWRLTRARRRTLASDVCAACTTGG